MILDVKSYTMRVFLNILSVNIREKVQAEGCLMDRILAQVTKKA